MRISFGSSAMAELMVQLSRETVSPTRRPLSPEARRRRSFFAALARAIHRPVGLAAILRRRRTDPTVWGVDGRAANALMVAGATVEDAAIVCRAAEENRLWVGYGSPHSIPAPVLLTLVEWGHGPGSTEWAALVSLDWNWSDKALQRRDGRLHPDWRHRAKEAMSAKAIIRTLWDVSRPIASDICRLSRRLRAHGVKPEEARLRAIAVVTEIPGASKMPLWRLRETVGSPRSQWWARGIEAPRLKGLPSPAGLPGNPLKALVALAEQQALALTEQTFANVIRAFQVWGPLAVVMASHLGVHDAAQVGGNQPLPEGWATYRETHRKWWADNADQALIAAGRAVAHLQLGETLLHPSEMVALERVAHLTPWEIDLLDRAKAVERESIPPVKAELQGLTLRSLNRGDALCMQLGELTHCCMHRGGAAESCLRHGTTNPDGGFWVVFSATGKVIAQSWVWRSDRVLVVDNIEAVRTTQGEHERLLPLYQMAANAMIGRLGIEVVRVGVGYSDIELPLPEANQVQPPPGVYTDILSGIRHLAGVRDLPGEWVW